MPHSGLFIKLEKGPWSSILFSFCEDTMTKATVIKGNIWYWGTCLRFQKISPWPSGQEADRHGSGAAAETFASWSTASRQAESQGLAWPLKLQSPPAATHLCQQGTSPYLSQTVLPTKDWGFKYMSLWGAFSFKPSQTILNIFKTNRS